MTHTRIRPPGTHPAPARAVVARGTMVFLHAQGPQDPDTGETVGRGDPAAQAERAMRSLANLLKECGSEVAHLCRVGVHLTDIRHHEAVERGMARHLGGVHPVVTVLAVHGLSQPDWLVAIEGTAVIPDADVPAELDPNVAVAAAKAGAEAPIPREPRRRQVAPKARRRIRRKTGTPPE